MKATDIYQISALGSLQSNVVFPALPRLFAVFSQKPGLSSTRPLSHSHADAEDTRPEPGLICIRQYCIMYNTDTEKPVQATAAV
jgi:hypothetical protein